MISQYMGSILKNANQFGGHPAEVHREEFGA